jgi:hypothetical protein
MFFKIMTLRKRIKMDQKQFADLVSKAKQDPKFLHSLIFSPLEVSKELAGVDRKALGSLIAQSPVELIARTVGITQYCGNTCTSSCDNTCGGSCGFTTNISTPAELVARKAFFSRNVGEIAQCGNTCTSSCDNTCGGSCGFTTNLTDFGQQVINQGGFR